MAWNGLKGKLPKKHSHTVYYQATLYYDIPKTYKQFLQFSSSILLTAFLSIQKLNFVKIYLQEENNNNKYISREYISYIKRKIYNFTYLNNLYSSIFYEDYPIYDI